MIILDPGVKFTPLISSLTIRDSFAAAALQGMMANGITIDIDGDYMFQKRAEVCFAIADAMLKARANQENT